MYIIHNSTYFVNDILILKRKIRKVGYSLKLLDQVRWIPGIQCLIINSVLKISLLGNDFVHLKIRYF